MSCNFLKTRTPEHFKPRQVGRIPLLRNAQPRRRLAADAAPRGQNRGHGWVPSVLPSHVCGFGTHRGQRAPSGGGDATYEEARTRRDICPAVLAMYKEEGTRAARKGRSPGEPRLHAKPTVGIRGLAAGQPPSSPDPPGTIHCDYKQQ